MHLAGFHFQRVEGEAGRDGGGRGEQALEQLAASQPRPNLAEVRPDVFAFALNAVAVHTERAAGLSKQNAALDRAAGERQQLGSIRVWAKCVGALVVRQELLEQFADAKVFVARRCGGDLESVGFDRLAKRGVSEHGLLQHQRAACLIEQLGQGGRALIALGQAEGVDLFPLRLHLAKPGGSARGVIERHVGDPVVHEFEAKRIDFFGAQVRHTTVALLGHAIEQHGPVRIARGNHAGVVEAEVALRRLKSDKLGSLKRKVMVEVKHRGATSTLMMAMRAVRVEVRAGTFAERRGGVVWVGQRFADGLRAFADEA